MEILKLHNPENQSFGSLVYEMIQTLSFFNLNDSDQINIDLSEIKNLYPFQLLPLVSLINQYISDKKSIYIKYPENQTYFNAIGFYKGFDLSFYSNWEKELGNYKDKGFLPILVIPTTPNKEAQKTREGVLSILDILISQQLNLSQSFRSPLNYLISEAIDNVCDHACIDKAMIMVQYFDSYFDLCITDNGIGLLGSYQSNSFSNIASDDVAMQQAIIGKSTKKQAISRGFGISTSRNLLVNGLNGEYFLFSGSAFYFQSKDHEQVVKIPNQNRWSGTILALRIPFQIPADFDFYKFLEY